MSVSVPSIPSQHNALVAKLPATPEDFKIQSIPTPQISNPLDVLVQVHASGTNPVDTKVRKGEKGKPEGDSKDFVHVIGYDSSGVVAAIGSKVTGFKVGDEVYYSGDITRPGSYQQYQLVDHRLVSLKPTTLTHAQAAALPLTTLTAWEALFELLRIKPGKRILILAGGGGVGSIAIQLAKHKGLQVITTGSRPESIAFAEKNGADIIIDHRKGFQNEFESRGLEKVDYIFNTVSSGLLSELIKVVKPFGAIVSITMDIPADIASVIRIAFSRRVELHWEYMFARSGNNTEPETQGQILAEIAKMVDAGVIKHTLTKTVDWSEVGKVHRELESGTNVGKTVLLIPASK